MYVLPLLQSIAGINYFNGVKSDLEHRGCKVITPQVSMTGSIEERAQQLDLQIVKLLNLPSQSTSTDKSSVHLICHSMGGLDARRLVHFSELRYKVLSITTVSTPHHGTPIASWPVEMLLDHVSGSGRGMKDMTPEHMADFNDHYKDVPEIHYFSITSKFDPQSDHILWASHGLIKRSGRHSKYPQAFGDNDGIVAVSSAIWGDFLGVLNEETSHFGVIGWGFLGQAAGDSNYDAKGLYHWLVDNVARKVEGKVAAAL
ncbi:Alpha/Beta hydrolase protein [Boletus coccyginus]|nr:Alpha/Beta hydrolase protein [Boletus coccyginus]